MPCLLDSSAITNLIKCGCLDLALAATGVQHADIEILGETYEIANTNRDRFAKPILTEPHRLNCLAFCQKVGRISSPWASQAEKLALQKKRDLWHGVKRVSVDGGEAQIFAYTHKVNNFSIWVADSKCLIALAMIPECQPIHSRVVGHVYCLERLIREMIAHHGYDTVAPKIVGCNKEIMTAIGSGKAKCPGLLLAAEQQLQKDCNGLLAP